MTDFTTYLDPFCAVRFSITSKIEKPPRTGPSRINGNTFLFQQTRMFVAARPAQRRNPAVSTGSFTEGQACTWFSKTGFGYLRNLERSSLSADDLCCMGSAIRNQNDFWPEHETATAPTNVVTHVESTSSLRNLLFGVQTETRVGSLLAAVGAIMLVKSGTAQLAHLTTFSFPPGPLEICGFGMLIWLHAKWRSATRLK
jgi:hypothetical protein